MNLGYDAWRLLLISLVIWSGSFAATFAVTYVEDQGNAVSHLTTSGNLQPGESLGQSFTPSQSLLDVFKILARGSSLTTAQLKIFTGQTAVGAPIAVSSVVGITNPSFQLVEFAFPGSVALVPEALYTARLELVTAPSFRLRFSHLNPYPRGLAFDELGNASELIDIVFSEGLLVPEGTSMSLAVVAVGVLIRRRCVTRFG